MLGTPKLVLNATAVETLFALSAGQRRRVLNVLEKLRHEHPQTTEDFAEQDESGRHVSVKTVRPVVIHYWLDGPVDELRVTRITLLKPLSR